MKILCCSDTHGKTPPIADDVDVRLHAGDVYDGWSLRGLGRKDLPTTRLLMRDTVAFFDRRDPPLLVVNGNHDAGDPLGLLAKAENVTGRVFALRDWLWLAGIGWSGTMFADLPGEAELEAVCESLRRQVRRAMKPSDRLIVLSHYPAQIDDPRREDPAWSFRCLRAFLDEQNPTLWIEGHLHSLAGRQWSVGRTRVLNPGARGAIVSLDEAGGVEAVEFLRSP